MKRKLLLSKKKNFCLVSFLKQCLQEKRWLWVFIRDFFTDFFSQGRELNEKWWSNMFQLSFIKLNQELFWVWNSTFEWISLTTYGGLLGFLLTSNEIFFVVTTCYNEIAVKTSETNIWFESNLKKNWPHLP